MSELLTTRREGGGLVCERDRLAHRALRRCRPCPGQQQLGDEEDHCRVQVLPQVCQCPPGRVEVTGQRPRAGQGDQARITPATRPCLLDLDWTLTAVVNAVFIKRTCPQKRNGRTADYEDELCKFTRSGEGADVNYPQQKLGKLQQLNAEILERDPGLAVSKLAATRVQIESAEWHLRRTIELSDRLAAARAEFEEVAARDTDPDAVATGRGLVEHPAIDSVAVLGEHARAALAALAKWEVRGHG